MYTDFALCLLDSVIFYNPGCNSLEFYNVLVQIQFATCNVELGT